MEDRMGGSLPKTALRPAELAPDRPAPFHLEPGPEARDALARQLGVQKMRKLRFAGALHPAGKRDWALRAELGATVVQACVVTLDPVTTRIDEPVQRTYLAHLPDLPEAEEVETPEDDGIEELPAEIDLDAVMLEALALALPAYPRSPEAEALDIEAAPPGAAPLDADQEKPFAGLAGLRAKMDRTGGPDEAG